MCIRDSAWTDDPAAFEQERDGPTGREPDATRPDAMRVLDTFLDAVLLQDASALGSLETGQFPGVEWNP